MIQSLSRRTAGFTLLLCIFALSGGVQAGFHLAPETARQLPQSVSGQWQRDYGGYVWLEGGDAVAAELAAAGIEFQRVPDAGILRVQGMRFDPVADRRGFGDAPRHAGGEILALVQFRGPVTGNDLARLRDEGLEPLQYYPGFGYLVWGQPDRVEATRSGSAVRWAGAFVPEMKIQPGLKARGGRIANVNVHFYNPGDPAAVLAELADAGARVLDAWPAQPDRRLWDAKITLDASGLDALASVAPVIALSYLSPEPALEDESATQTLAGNLDASNIPFPGYPAWLGQVELDGSGVTWAVTDTGIWYQHGDIASRITGGQNYPGCNETNPGDDPTSGGHGTHVAGIFGGDGAAGFTDGDGFLYGLGMAPAVSFFAQNPICGSQSSWPPTGGWPVLSRDAILGGAIGSNNSWTSGEGTQHGYQSTERTYDLMVLDGDFETDVLEPFMVVFSAGNSGSSGVTAPKEAKNVVVTGGTQTFRVSGDVDAIYGSSSRGPAVDGRILPTISAPGQQVSSARRDSASSCASAIGGTDGEYAFCTGTSMAAPHASGALILLSEWWRNGNAGQDPSPAMGKALLVNGARALSGSVPPNNDIGWGRVDLSPMVDSGLIFEFWDQEEVFTESGQDWTRTVGVVDPEAPVKITLVWSDAPGAVGANPALVNDLDLVVESGGQTYLGNVTDGGVSVPGGDPDRLHNLEQVILGDPGGAVTITVDAFQVAGSVLLDQPGVDTAQHFALVCQNCLEQPDFTLAVEPAAAMVCAPDAAQFDIDIGSLLGYDDPVSLDTGTLPGGVSALFSQTNVTPPGTSTLELDAASGADLGIHAVELEADSASGLKTRTLSFGIFDQVPQQPLLTAPADGAFNTDLDPEFSWQPTTQAGEYLLEIATDPAFGDIVVSQSASGESLALVQPLDSSTVYYWRVTAANACGQDTSETFSFSTRPEPGDCPLGTDTMELFGDDVEDGAGDWQVSDQGIVNTWQRSQVRAASGDWSWHAEDVSEVSDQRLISPPIALPGPSLLPLTLRFQNWQEIESASGSNCWDAGILEISTDDGDTWAQVADDLLLTQPYDGEVNNFSTAPNPLVGLDAWCGDTVPWTENVVDLSGHAGEVVRLRFRMGTDGTVGREGWYVDDIRVEACGGEVLFDDGFES